MKIIKNLYLYLVAVFGFVISLFSYISFGCFHLTSYCGLFYSALAYSPDIKITIEKRPLENFEH